MDIDQKKVLENGLYQKYRDLQRAQYKFACARFNYNLLTQKEIEDLQLDYFFSNYVDYNDFVACRRLYDNTRARIGRLRKRISNMLDNKCLFLTLTFTNNTLNNTSESTRRVYVTRFLKSLNCKYVANIDYGAKNHREHYHALIDIDNIDYSLWSYGSINGIRVLVSNDMALAKYIAKLTNHAIKETTKSSRIIYNR